MEIKDIQRNKRKEKKVPISLRISKELSEWMRKNNVSPTKLFVSAIEQMKSNKKSKK